MIFGIRRSSRNFNKHHHYFIIDVSSESTQDTSKLPAGSGKMQDFSPEISFEGLKELFKEARTQRQQYSQQARDGATKKEEQSP